MTLSEKINQDYVTAFKNRETDKVAVLRLLKSALKNEAIKIEGLNYELNDTEAMAVLNREVKQRKDSISQYEAAGRPELAANEQSELRIIEEYLPKAMDEAALAEVVMSVIAETGASQKSDMGKVMGALKERLDNPADVSRAAALVSQKLS